MSFNVFFHVIGVLIYTYSGVSAQTKCYRDKSIGDKAGNTYMCANPDEPECCEEGNEFKCCESKTSKTLREQLILWGGVAAFVLLISILGVCVLKDVKYCRSQSSLKDKCSCCKRNDEDTYIPKEEYKTKYKPYRGHLNNISNEELKIRPESSYSTLAGGSWQKYY